MTKIVAKVVAFTDDGYSTLLGFADDFYNPINYLTLTMTNDPDEQDLRLGQAGVYVEVGLLAIEGYDLVQDICETDSGVVVSLISKASQATTTSQNIEIELASKVIDGVPLNQAVQRFKDRLSLRREAP